MELLLAHLAEIVAMVIAIFVITAVRTSLGYMNQKLMVQSDNEMLKRALVEIENFTSKAVGEMMQLKVEDLKKDGGFNPSHQHDVKQSVMETVLGRLSDPTTDYINKNIGPVNDVISSEIEDTVLRYKKLG
jgi:hypothetical protein